MTQILHILTIHGHVSRAVTTIVMAGIAQICKREGLTWWVNPPDPNGDIKVMIRAPKAFQQLTADELLEAYGDDLHHPEGRS